MYTLTNDFESKPVLNANSSRRHFYRLRGACLFAITSLRPSLHEHLDGAVRVRVAMRVIKSMECEREYPCEPRDKRDVGRSVNYMVKERVYVCAV